MRFEQPKASSAVRWVYAGLAFIYFTVAGMLLYFRFVSFQRVLERFQDQEAPLPIWFDLVFTVGIGMVLLLLIWRGVASLRKARQS